VGGVNYFNSKGESAELSFSSQNFKVLKGVSIVGYTTYGSYIGPFEYYNTKVKSELVYVDRDVIITGRQLLADTLDYPMIQYNLSLKRGWNYIFDYDAGLDGGHVTTTANPETLRWYFTGNMDDVKPDPEMETLNVICRGYLLPAKGNSADVEENMPATFTNVEGVTYTITSNNSGYGTGKTFTSDASGKMVVKLPEGRYSYTISVPEEGEWYTKYTSKYTYENPYYYYQYTTSNSYETFYLDIEKGTNSEYRDLYKAPEPEPLTVYFRGYVLPVKGEGSGKDYIDEYIDGLNDANQYTLVAGVRFSFQDQDITYTSGSDGKISIPADKIGSRYRLELPEPWFLNFTVSATYEESYYYYTYELSTLSGYTNWAGGQHGSYYIRLYKSPNK
jgi:hypothetical protein